MSTNNVVAPPQPQQVNQQPGQPGAPPAVPPPPPPAGPPAAKAPGAPAIPNLKPGGQVGTAPSTNAPGTPAIPKLNSAGQPSAPPAASAPGVPAIPNLKPGGQVGTAPSINAPDTPTIPNLKTTGQLDAPPVTDVSGAPVNPNLQSAGPSSSPPAINALSAPITSSLQSAGQPSAPAASNASDVPVIVANDQGINAPTPEEIAAQASLLGGQSIQPQQPPVGATSPGLKDQLLNVTPEEEAAGMSIQSGLKAISQNGGQSLDPGNTNRQLNQSLPTYTGTAVELKTSIQIDVDGAPKAYGPSDKAALDYELNAHVHAKEGGKIVGYETQSDGKTPIVQGPNDPAPGFYIAETSFQDKSLPKTDPNRFVDASRINYVVRGDFAKSNNVHLGDLVAVYSNKTGRSAFGIVGDGGNKKGAEGSLALVQNLGYSATSGKKGGVDKQEVTIRYFPGSNPTGEFFHSQEQIDAHARSLGLSKIFQ